MPRSNSSGTILHLIYGLSGATALVYEVVWTRLLTLELGHTVAAASAVLAGFMGGLALGAVVGGRVAGRLSPERALKGYAALEVAIGMFALAVPWVLRALHPALGVAYGATGGPSFEAARLLAALAVISSPAAMMGATYPLIVRAGGIHVSATASLYAANTAGATMGSLGAGFLLLPSLGMFRSTLVAAVGNGVIAAVAWRLWTKGPAASSVARPSEGRVATLKHRAHNQPVNGSASEPTAPLGLPLGVAALSGGCALGLEVVWTRTLAMIMGPTTYAFSAMVGCFIAGMAAGSATGAWLLRRSARDDVWLAVTLASAAAATAAAVNFVDAAVLSVAGLAARPEATFGSLLRLEFSWAVALVSPGAFFFGATFPFALALADAEAPARAAAVYAANTVGAVAGALAAGLLLIPQLGLHGSFLVLVGLLASACVLVLAQSGRPALTAVPPALLALAAVTLLVRSDWNPALLSSGGYKYAPYLGGEHLRELLEAGTLRYYEEGAASTVAVRDLTGVRSLSIDGKVDASSGADMLTQRLLAHVPLLLHPDPGRVGIVGLGSGVTLASALAHPIVSAEVVEISPQVIEAAGWFAAENRGALADPRTRLVQGDARTHFRLSSNTAYDVIISEPSNPWMAGVAALFTREFFTSISERLAPGGIACQWAHTYDISEADLRSIVATFTSVFEHVALWIVGDGDMLLVGSASRRLTQEALRSDAAAAVLTDLASSGIPRIAVLKALNAGDTAVARRWSHGAVLQSDDRMALEFSAPGRIVGRSDEDLAAGLLSGTPEPGLTPEDLRDAALALLRAHAPRRAWEILSGVIRERARDSVALEALLRAATGSDHQREAERILSDIRQADPGNVPALAQQARLFAAQGALDQAWRVIDAAPLAMREDLYALHTIAAIAADSGDRGRLAAAVQRLRARVPGGARTPYYEAVLKHMSGEAAAAVALVERALVLDPSHAAGWNVLGAALAETGAPPDTIRRAFEQAVSTDPSDPSAYVNLGTMRLQAGDLRQATDWFAQALTIDPDNATARSALAAILRER